MATATMVQPFGLVIRNFRPTAWAIVAVGTAHGNGPQKIIFAL